MHLLIDAYNVLHFASSQINDDVKDIFLHLLCIYAKKKNIDITLVYDGGSSPFEHHRSYGHVSVVYSGYQIDADTYLIKKFNAYPASKIILVTADRTIINHAQKRNILVMEPQALLMLIKHTTHKKSQAQPLVKTTTYYDVDLDRAIERWSRTVQHKTTCDDDVKTERASKEERVLKRVLKKL